MIDTQEFLLRLAALLGFSTLAICWRKKSSTASREYAFLLFSGLLGAVYGTTNDWITVTISPDYFERGKQIPVEDLPSGALILGAQAGFVAGVVLGAILLAANSLGCRGSLSMIELSRSLFASLLVVISVEAGVGFLFTDHLPSIPWTRSLSPQAATDTRLVWALHIGAYVGGVLAAGIACIRIQILRRRDLIS